MTKKLIVLSLLLVSGIKYAQLNAQGFNMALQMGGTGSDYGDFVATDNTGNIYIAGHFGNIGDFNPGAAVYNLYAAGGPDVFILKLNAAGNFIWAKQIGGTYADGVNGLSVDNGGNVYTIGYFKDTVDFDPGTGVYNLVTPGGIISDAFILKLDSAGNFSWVKQFGSIYDDLGAAIDLDASGNIYATGDFRGTVDFDPGPGTYTIASGLGLIDVFILKLDPSGNFAWAKHFTGSGNNHSSSIVLNNTGDIYTAGNFNNTADFDPGITTFNLQSAGYEDIFVTKLDTSGNFAWANKCGGTGHDFMKSMVVNSTGDIVFAGKFEGTGNFLGTTLTSVGGIDIYMVKLNPAGSALWVKQMGGTTNEEPFSMVTDALQNIYCTGHFTGTTDFDPSAGTYNLTSAGFFDMFICALNTSGTFLWAERLGAVNGDGGMGITLDASQNIYVSGTFQNTVDFDPGTGIFNLSSTNNTLDAFLLKLNNSTGIESLNNPFTQINLFPNPAKDALTISGFSLTDGKAEVKVFDVYGRKVLEKQLNISNCFLSITNFTKGIYFVEISSGGNVNRVRFVKN